MTTTAQHYVEACERKDIAKRCRYETATINEPADPRLSAPGALPKAAIWYARHGIAVFPCEYRGKKPLTNNGFKDATTDETQIIEWWTRRPDANIGAPTGITFDVIDLDGAEAVAAIYFGKDRPYNTLPAQIGHALTPHMPGHHLFIEPTGRGNTANIYPGVDYRGKSGYVILPPSVGDNGRLYCWTTPLKIEES